MAKRSTIGENPLDFLMAENPLDTVVPEPGAASRASKVEDRLERLEAGVDGLQLQAAKAGALGPEISRALREAAQLHTEVAGLKGELVRLQAEVAPLKAEMAGLKAEVAQLRAKLVPSDVPWWLGGKKK